MNSYFIAASVFHEKRDDVLSWLCRHNAEHDDVILLINDVKEAQMDASTKVPKQQASDARLRVVDLSDFDMEKRDEAIEKAEYLYLAQAATIKGLLFVCNDLSMLELFHAITHRFYLMPRSITNGELRDALRILRIKAFLRRGYFRLPFVEPVVNVLRFGGHGVRYVLKRLY